MKNPRLKLLQTSARLFAKKSYGDVSVREIVASANMNVSAIKYHFGDKRSLFLETVKYLAQVHHKPFLTDQKLTAALDQLDNLSRQQTLDLLHSLLDKVIDLGLDKKTLPLERIFTHAALSDSKETLRLLFSFMEKFHTRPYKIMSKLTGLQEKSQELVLITHVIFGQINFSECHRIALLHDLGEKEYTPHLHQMIKEMVWNNTLAILNLYDKGNQLK